jgi:prevent-host-death family protein
MSAPEKLVRQLRHPDEFVPDYDHDRGCGMAKKGSVAEAKAKFSKVIDLARSQGSQTLTRNGRTVVVIVAADEWERKNKRRGNLAEFFAASPLR